MKPQEHTSSSTSHQFLRLPIFP